MLNVSFEVWHSFNTAETDFPFKVYSEEEGSFFPKRVIASSTRTSPRENISDFSVGRLPSSTSGLP